jgi:nitroreductase
MEFRDVIRLRRSIRSYRDTPIEDEKLARVLDAARLAPTAANRQPIHLYVVRSEEVRRRLLSAYSQEWFAGAPVIICVCGRPSRAWSRMYGKNYADVDATIAMDHLILAATAEGLGTCWIGAFRPERLREVLGIPGDLEPVALTPLGYAASQPSPTPRKPLDEICEYI